MRKIFLACFVVMALSTFVVLASSEHDFDVKHYDELVVSIEKLMIAMLVCDMTVSVPSQFLRNNGPIRVHCFNSLASCSIRFCPPSFVK